MVSFGLVVVVFAVWGGGGGGVTTRVVFSVVFFAEALAVGGGAAVSSGLASATTGGVGSAETAWTTGGLSGCVAASGLSFGTSELDDKATTKMPINKTAPPAAPAAISNCFLLAPVRLPASEAVPEKVGCGMPTMFCDSLVAGFECESIDGLDCESIAGYWIPETPSGCGDDVGAIDGI